MGEYILYIKLYTKYLNEKIIAQNSTSKLITIYFLTQQFIEKY